MRLKKEHIATVGLESSRILFLLLWVYTAVVKFGNMSYNLDTMRKQIFAEPIADILAYLVPIMALICAGLLIYSIRLGLWASMGLLSIFSIYIIVFLTEIIRKQTCSCAGILPEIDYPGHLLFNSIMLAIAVAGLLLYYKILHGDAENREQSRQLNTIYKHHE